MGKRISRPPIWRQYVVMAALFGCAFVIVMRVIQIQTVEQRHLQAQGDARYLRQIVVPPERGKILDRNGQVLAVSTPVESLSAEPAVFCAARDQWSPMSRLLDIKTTALAARCQQKAKANFMYIKRRLPPALVEQVMAMHIPGLELQREYRRYYPGGPVGAHLIGFTDVDDVGQEGLERHYNQTLQGRPGRKRVLKDLAGNYVESVESIQRVQPGADLMISIDQRVQSLASNYLEQAVKQHNASGGSVVVLSIPSGEIISMVNSPQFNPNDRATMKKGVFRNKAVTDVFEPGSTAKPFTVGMVLDSGQVGVNAMVDTAPGYYQIGGSTIYDIHNHGEISVFDVIVRSSNIGSAKLALAFPFEKLFKTFRSTGFGQQAANLPGEVSGSLVKRTQPIEHATLAYGYGLSVTLLQLARAYTAFATDGEILPVTLRPQPDGFRAAGRPVFSQSTVTAMRAMMERAATSAGTADKARIAGYRVGGKTGTTHKLVAGNYNNKRYVALFAGIAPITAPRFVMVVSIDDPRGKYYYGGDVAAPVFADLMKDLMRLYNVRPDGIAQARLADITQPPESA